MNSLLGNSRKWSPKKTMSYSKNSFISASNFNTRVHSCFNIKNRSKKYIRQFGSESHFQDQPPSL